MDSASSAQLKRTGTGAKCGGTGLGVCMAGDGGHKTVAGGTADNSGSVCLRFRTVARRSEQDGAGDANSIVHDVARMQAVDGIALVGLGGSERIGFTSR